MASVVRMSAATKRAWVHPIECPFCGQPSVTADPLVSIRYDKIREEKDHLVLFPMFVGKCFLCLEESYLDEEVIPDWVKREAQSRYQAQHPTELIEE